MGDIIFKTDGEETFRLPSGFFLGTKTPEMRLEIKEMTEIEKLEVEIKTLQDKLVILKQVEKFKSQKLWNIMRDKLGFSIDMCDEIVDAVEEWLPKEQSAAGSQNVDTELLVDGFNHCLEKMKGMLR